VINGKTASLQAYLLHESYQPVFQWLDKHNQFSDWSVKRYALLRAEGELVFRNLLSRDHLTRRRALRSIFIRLPFRPLFMFGYLYIFRRGFLDGRAGLYYCLLLSFYELMISIKTYEQTTLYHIPIHKLDREC
jgi:hypothetical protein